MLEGHSIDGLRRWVGLTVGLVGWALKKKKPDRQGGDKKQIELV